MQRITPGTEMELRNVEKTLQSSLFSEKNLLTGKGTLGWGVIQHPTKKSGLAPLDTTQSARENLVASCVVTAQLMYALWGRTAFWTGNNSMVIKEGSSDIRCRNSLTSQQADVKGTLPDHDA